MGLPVLTLPLLSIKVPESAAFRLPMALLLQITSATQVIVLISYQDGLGEKHSLEWVCQSDWTMDQVINCFKERYASATLISALQLNAHR